MKKVFTTLAIILSIFTTHAQNNFGIGTNSPAASAALDVTSTSQGILVPRMTTAARNAITSPAKGLMVYDSTLNNFYYHTGTAWMAVGGLTSYPNVELYVDKNGAPQTPIATDGTTATIYDLTFSTSNSSNASLTGGNSWNGSKFTVGTTGAGWYQIAANITGGPINSLVFPHLEVKNSAGTTLSSIYASTSSNFSTATAAPDARASFYGLVYLNAGDNFTLRYQAAGTSSTSAIDATSTLSATRIK